MTDKAFPHEPLRHTRVSDLPPRGPTTAERIEALIAGAKSRSREVRRAIVFDLRGAALTIERDQKAFEDQDISRSVFAALLREIADDIDPRSGV